MGIYNIKIEEVLQRVVTIEAGNKEEALRFAREKYEKEEIALNENYFKGDN